jgi:sigma-E factor negative regulatory protein RseC
MTNEIPMSLADTPDHTVEGFAHVVRVEGDVAWLEPEQTTSCGGCASAQLCGSKGIGSVASRLEARRFQIDNGMDLAVGERIVVGVNDGALIKASLTVYAIPLATTLTAGCVAQWAAGRDGVTMAAMAAGLGLGLLLARFGAARLSARGELAPRVLRRAAPDETCLPK